MREPPNPITKINLKLLQTFMLIAEHNSFRVAADLTHRSQSAVSSQIKQLELQLGVTLLHRTTRSVRLTAAGEKLLETTRRALLEVNSGLQEIYDEANQQGHRVSLACSTSIGPTYLPAILAAFESEHPDVRVVIRELPSRELFPSVRSGDFDFALGSRGKSVSSVDFDPLIDDEFMAVTSQDFLPELRNEVSLERLSEEPLLLPTSTLASRQTLDQAARMRALTLTPKYESAHQGTLVAMAEARLGVAVLRRSVAYGSIRSPIRMLRIVDPTVSRSVGIIRIRGQELSPQAERLAQLCAQLLPWFIADPNTDGGAVPPPASLVNGNARQALYAVRERILNACSTIANLK